MTAREPNERSIVDIKMEQPTAIPGIPPRNRREWSGLTAILDSIPKSMDDTGFLENFRRELMDKENPPHIRTYLYPVRGVKGLYEPFIEVWRPNGKIAYSRPLPKDSVFDPRRR